MSAVIEKFRPLFYPRGIVVTGVSQHPGKFGTVDGNKKEGAGAKGAAVSLNRLQNEVQAWISGATTTVQAPVVTVTADDNGDVEAYVVSGAGASGSALGGSIAVNWNETTVEAWIADATVTAVSAESLIANNRSSNNLTANVTFPVVYDGKTIPVTVTAGSFGSAERDRSTRNGACRRERVRCLDAAAEATRCVQI